MQEPIFPGDAQCAILEEIINQILLLDASEEEKNIAIQGISLAKNLLGCDD